MAPNNRSLWAARVCIGAVLLANVQCAVVFWWSPQIYTPAFELAGVAGEAAVRGVGVLFLMWNVPYLIALWHPRRHRVSLWEAVAMQAIGVAGETIIALTLPPGYVTLRASLMRFILFDGGGLAILLLAAWLSRAHADAARHFSS
jgi:hypothetical protein